MDLIRCLPPSQNAACDRATFKKSLDYITSIKSRKFLSETVKPNKNGEELHQGTHKKFQSQRTNKQ